MHACRSTLEDPTTPEDISELALPLLRAGRIIGSFDEQRLVGLAAILDKQLTFPGGRSAPVAAVTWVGVQPGEQRRGLLRGLMTHQLHGLHDENREPIAILTASESGIYGRFGYGMAVPMVNLSMPAGLALRPGVPVERVREVSREEALPLLRALYERRRSTRCGYLTRDDTTWNELYRDLPSQRRGDGSLRFAVHPDGVLAFRIALDWEARGPNHKLNVHELCAMTSTAEASLWHFALNRAMVREINYHRYGPDEILQDLLVETRAARTLLRDNIWLRIVDVDRAVPLRSYSVDLRIRVDVTDQFCPWNAGVWEFDLNASGGKAERSDQPAQLSLDITELGAVFLGGSRLTRLAAAGWVSGDPEAIAALDVALSTDRAPYCPEGF